MPTEAVVGSSVELKCEWRILGVSNLYSVKWYKDDHEFFRYVPDNNPKTQMFPRAGVKVEVRISNRFCRNLISNINVLVNTKSITNRHNLYISISISNTPPCVRKTRCHIRITKYLSISEII